MGVGELGNRLSKVISEVSIGFLCKCLFFTFMGQIGVRCKGYGELNGAGRRTVNAGLLANAFRQSISTATFPFTTGSHNQNGMGHSVSARL